MFIIPWSFKSFVTVYHFRAFSILVWNFALLLHLVVRLFLLPRGKDQSHSLQWHSLIRVRQWWWLATFSHSEAKNKIFVGKSLKRMIILFSTFSKELEMIHFRHANTHRVRSHRWTRLQPLEGNNGSCRPRLHHHAPGSPQSQPRFATQRVHHRGLPQHCRWSFWFGKFICNYVCTILFTLN